ncbi:MAG TPA: hypothetical protein VI854_09025 [Acidimicrobiia bacterium]|nr:hypothetical protein [Acidimicrobiia bacterium]
MKHLPSKSSTSLRGDDRPPTAGRRARRGAILTLIGFALLSVIGLLAASAAPAPKITAKGHEGQKKVAGVLNGYTAGNITEYTERDFVNYRFTLEATDATDGLLEVRFSADDTVCLFFDGTFSLGTHDGSAAAIVPVSGATPTVTPVGAPLVDGTEWVQTLDIDFSGAGTATVNYFLRLSDEAGECSGSSQHSRLSPAGGSVGQTGAQNVPIPADQIIELPEIVVEKNIDRDADGTFESDAAAGEYCFSLDGGACVPVGANGEVTFTNVTPDGTHTITETQLDLSQGIYSFVSGSGTNCTFSGSTATATVASGTTSTDARCIFNNAAPNLAPTVTVTKDAVPADRPEPGGDFTFIVTVTNTSTTEAVTITNLFDSIYNLATVPGDCDDLVGDTLAIGASATCSFTGNFTGNAGDTETDTVTVVVIDNDGQTADDTDDATVSLTDVAPSVTVDKTVAPGSLPEPGGDFTFTVEVTNTSAEDVTITSLDDDVYGDLAAMPGDCDDIIGDTLAPAASATCSFTGNFTGNAGDSETDTVTVVVTDDDDETGTDTDDATVSLTGVAPSVTVDKTASPLSLPEPGGDFTFTVVVTNTSSEDVTITSLTDSIYDLGAVVGDCDDLVGDILAPTASATCTFTGNFTGVAGDSETDTVTVVVTDDDAQTATDTDDATVSIDDAAYGQDPGDPGDEEDPYGEDPYGQDPGGRTEEDPYQPVDRGDPGDPGTEVAGQVLTPAPVSTPSAPSLDILPDAALTAPAVAPAAGPLPMAELPRTGSREVQRQVFLALGLIVAGGSARFLTRRRRSQSA